MSYVALGLDIKIEPPDVFSIELAMAYQQLLIRGSST